MCSAPFSKRMWKITDYMRPGVFLVSFPSLLHTVNIMVVKQAMPPTKLEMGSARNTPVVPSPATVGSQMVSGMTMMAFRNSEKKIACLE